MIKQTLKVASVILLGASVAAMAQPKPPRVVPYKFFNEEMPEGGDTYAYGGKSKGFSIDAKNGFKSKAALNLKLDPSEYSGAQICLKNDFFFDMDKVMLDGKLEFMVKGKKGGEALIVGLLDEKNSDCK